MLPSSPLSVAVPAGPLPARRSRGSLRSLPGGRHLRWKSLSSGRLEKELSSRESPGELLFLGGCHLSWECRDCPSPNLCALPAPRTAGEGFLSAGFFPGRSGCSLGSLLGLQAQTLVSPLPAGPWGL